MKDNFKVERVGNEPILYAEAWGDVTQETILGIVDKVQELRKDMPKFIYRIANFSNIETTFTEMMRIMQVTNAQRPSTSTDPTLTPIFVGDSHWLKLFRDALRQGAFRGREVFLFDSVDEALAFARADIIAKTQPK